MGEPVVVLGGGLAGLSAALTSGAPVYEAEARFGGVGSSDRAEGFTFDRGIHVLQSKNPRILKLLDELGVQMLGHSRQGYIHSHGVFTAYPFQVNTAGMPLSLRARCVWGFLNRDKEAEPKNYEEWIRANVGEGFAETFLIPYSEKFWTVPPRQMTHEWTGNRIPQPTTAQVLRGALWSRQTRVGTNADFRYPAGAAGYGAIADALARKVGRVHGGHRARHIDTRTRDVHFENGRSVRYERLVSTLPLPELVAMFPDAPAAIRTAAAALRANSILVVNLGIARKGNNNWHWVHFPERDVSFFRISFPHNFTEDLVPPGMSSISAEVAYPPDRPPDHETALARVIDDLRRVGILERDDRVVYSSLRDIRYAYCIYDFERKAAVRAIREWLGRFDIIPAGRYGMWSYFWSDEAMMSGLLAGEKARRSLDTTDTTQDLAVAND
ncbi:N/A [soil metagenome]